MKHRLVWYGLLIAVLVGGVPYITGMIAEQRFLSLVETLSSFEHLQIEVLDYQRGWLRSQAQTRVILTGGPVTALLTELGEEAGVDESSEQQIIRVRLAHKIKHGPFVQQQKGNYKDWSFAQAKIVSKLSLSEEAKAQLTDTLGHTDFLNITTLLNIAEDICITLEGKPLQVEEETIWGGIHAQWRVSEQGHTVKADIQMPEFNFDTKYASYKAENIHLQSVHQKNKQAQQPMWDVSQSYQLEHLYIQPNKKPKLSFSQLKLIKAPKTAWFSLNAVGVDILGQLYGPLKANVTINSTNIQGQFLVNKKLLTALYQYGNQTAAQKIEISVIDQKIKNQFIKKQGDALIAPFVWQQGELQLP